MDYFRNFYGTPGQFGNWQQYAGFDPNKTMMSGGTQQTQQTQQTGVAPPSTFGEMGQQMIDTATSRFKNLGTNISNATEQLSQGNVLGGIRAAQGVAPPGAPMPPAAPSAPSTAPMDDYDYTSNVGR